jgi:PleD family two-component response regulator
MTTDMLAPAEIPSARGVEPVALAGRKPHRILVVDDDPAVRALFDEVLTETGHEVDTAADGAEGLLLSELAR